MRKLGKFLSEKFIKPYAEKGSFCLEYAIILAFVVITLSITELNPFVSSIAEDKTSNANINASAYYTEPEKEHTNNVVPITPEGPEEPKPEEPPEIKEIVDSGNLVNQLEKGYYEKKTLLLVDYLGKTTNGNYVRLKYGTDDRLELSSSSKYLITVKDPNYKMSDNGKIYSLADYDIQFIVASDVINGAFSEYFHHSTDYVNLGTINDSRFIINTDFALLSSYFLIYNVKPKAGSHISQNGLELEAIAYMLQENLVIEKIS